MLERLVWMCVCLFGIEVIYLSNIMQRCDVLTLDYMIVCINQQTAGAQTSQDGEYTRSDTFTSMDSRSHRQELNIRNWIVRREK
jgi:hypothetical protein